MDIKKKTSQILISSQYVNLHTYLEITEHRYNPEKKLTLKEKNMSALLYVTSKNRAYPAITEDND